jgi:uncharacterized membrane protein
MEIIQDNRFDKMMGLVAYMTLIGWVVALVQNNDKTGEEKRFTAFHLRQMLGLMIVAFCVWILQVPLLFVPLLGWLISMALSVALLVSWILAVVGAANGEKREIPFLGPFIQATFKNLFD